MQLKLHHYTCMEALQLSYERCLMQWLKDVPPSYTCPTLAELCEALTSSSVKEHGVTHDLEQQYLVCNLQIHACLFS